MKYKYLMYFILFIIFFIILYALYYVLFVRKQVKYDKKKISSDLRILTGYYKIDVEKIGFQKVLRILNLVNSLMMASLMMVVINIDKTIFKILILFVLMIPSIWVVYYFLAKYLKHLERKSENV